MKTNKKVKSAIITFTLLIVLSFIPAAYAAGGDLDSTFGTNGKAVTDFGGNDWALARYNSDGFLDSSFGSGGKVITDFGASDKAYAVDIQSDGKIVVAGTSGSDFALARYNSDGSLDTTFDTDGKVVTDIDASTDERGNAVALQTDGKIVVAGSHNAGDSFALARYEGDAVNQLVYLPVIIK